MDIRFFLRLHRGSTLNAVADAVHRAQSFLAADFRQLAAQVLDVAVGGAVGDDAVAGVEACSREYTRPGAAASARSSRNST